MFSKTTFTSALYFKSKNKQRLFMNEHKEIVYFEYRYI